jgi:hypothetical protein
MGAVLKNNHGNHFPCFTYTHLVVLHHQTET